MTDFSFNRCRAWETMKIKSGYIYLKLEKQASHILLRLHYLSADPTGITEVVAASPACCPTICCLKGQTSPPSVINKIFKTTGGLREPAELLATNPHHLLRKVVWNMNCGLPAAITEPSQNIIPLHLPRRGFNSSPALSHHRWRNSVTVPQTLTSCKNIEQKLYVGVPSWYIAITRQGIIQILV